MFYMAEIQIPTDSEITEALTTRRQWLARLISATPRQAAEFIEEARTEINRCERILMNGGMA